MNNQAKGVKVNILTLGGSGVGKSSLLQRYQEGKFEGNLNTTLGITYNQKQIILQDVPLLLQLWDTAGQEKFRSIPSVYYRSCDGVLLVFDITDSDTFEQIEYWIKDLQKETDLNKVVLTLVGNKSDLEDKRTVEFNIANEKAKQYNIEYFETSAKKNSNVDQVFEQIVKQIIEKKGGIEKYKAIYQEQIQAQVSLKADNPQASGSGQQKTKSSCC